MSEGATASGQAMLHLCDVSKSYPLGESRVDVLQGVSLDLPAGQMCAVMGPSGVGKSTLLNCVAGIETADRGAIEVLGADLVAMNENARTLHRRRHIGIVYQFFNLVANLSVYENVILPFLIDGAPVDEAAARAMLDRVGMTKRITHLPAQLSGGEMQLVSIARALVRRPALVLADEPTGNVNVATGQRIMTLLAAVLRETGSATLLVTHNPKDAATADRVVFMRDGALLGDHALAGDEVTEANVHDRLRELGI